MNHGRGIAHHRGIINEESGQRIDERDKEQRHRADEGHRDDERGMVTAAHAVIIPRAEVLRGERGHGHAERLGDHPHDAVQAGGKAPASHGVRSERIHRGLHDDVRDRIE